MGRGPKTFVAAAMAVAAVFAGACTVLTDLDGFDSASAQVDAAPLADGEGGSTSSEGGGGDAGGSSDAAPDGPSCGGRGVGSSMVRVLDAGFCIDVTEVTLDQFVEFLATNPKPTAIECQWKKSFNAPAFAGNAAIGNVDWCDAYEYCKWAGKRLCGGIGGAVMDLVNSKTVVDEWHFTCTHGGNPQFPWATGLGPKPSVCLYSDSPDSGAARAVASNPACTGPDGIYDLTGNVWEWEDACDRAAPDYATADCNLRGGGFLRPSNSWGSCAAVPSGWTRSSRTDDTGIRCCSDFK